MVFIEISNQPTLIKLSYSYSLESSNFKTLNNEGNFVCIEFLLTLYKELEKVSVNMLKLNC